MDINQSDLNFFKETLHNRKVQILQNLDGVEDEMDQLSSCEINDHGDYIAISNSTLIDKAISKQQRQELKAIDLALEKIANGTYGTCEMCGADITVPRLKVKPHAIYCIDCRGYIENNPE